MPGTPMTSIRTTGDRIEIINQLLLPHTTEWLEISSIQEAHGAIKSMKIRGAPAIASLAALSLAQHVTRALAASPPAPWLASPEALKQEIQPLLDYLYTARPTAVNLGAATRRLSAVLASQSAAGEDGAQARELAERLVSESKAVADEDVGRNREMGKWGAEWVLEQVQKREGKARKVKVLTVCNTGSLATSGYGTALGVITHLFETGNLDRAYYTQSTPYHQGSRLTALELLTLGAPSCMICDSMVGSLFQHHKIDAVLIGADRIVANGDTANKIGSYNAAVLAARHNVPFVVVAPISTVDLAVADGSGIPIEHRPPIEACTARGALYPPTLDASGNRAQATVLITPVLSSIASLLRPSPPAASSSSFSASSIATPGGAPDVLPPSTPSQDTDAKGPVGGEGEAPEELQQVYNPSFDVTPADLISAIVTEKGVAVKEQGVAAFDLVKSGVA